MQLVLHAGMGKCGSSALQTYLSRSIYLKNDEGDWLYAAIRPGGQVLSGENLRRQAAQGIFGYVSSSAARKCLGAVPIQLLLRQRLKILGRDKKIILSNEGWTSELAHWQSQKLFKEHKDLVDIIIYVRPPAIWLNSAWWQWGAWSSKNFSVWLKRHLAKVCWSNGIRQWQEMPFVRKVYVRVLSSDIVKDFCTTLGFHASEDQLTTSVNRSLPNGILRLFQTYPELRPSAHASQIDFVLSQHLDLPGKPDWVIDSEQIQYILDETRESNRDLLKLTDDSTREKIVNDPLWWSIAAYKSFTATSPSPMLPKYEELEEIARKSILTTLSLFTEIRSLKKQVATQNNPKSFWPFKKYR